LSIFSDRTYTSDLAEFVDKRIREWSRQKKQKLEPKLRANYDAVTNQAELVKKWKKGEAEGWRSDTWIGFVRVKVWSFYSILLDTVLKAGKIPFTLDPSPYDESYMDQNQLAQRDSRIEKMKDKIESQLTVRSADREYMKKWLSGGYYGMAFSKFNIEEVWSTEFRQVDMGLGDVGNYLSTEELSQYVRYETVREAEDVPGFNYVSVWNMVWDMEGDSLQTNDGYAEHIASSAYDLRQLIGKLGYLDESIKEVIEKQKNDDRQNNTEEGPSEYPGKDQLYARKQKFRRYEFYMRAPKVLCESFEKDIKSKKGDVIHMRSLLMEYDDIEESGDDIEIMGEICNGEIIRYIRNDTGERSHNMWVVETNLDETTGTGIADNMDSVQSSLVGMIRAFEDNKKLSANVTSAVKKRYFNNPSQLDDVVPGKSYDIADSCDDVRKAIFPIIFPDVGESLLSGINLMMQLKDDVSMIPTIMQGFSLPKQKTDTAYELKQLTEMAGKYIGQAIRNNDEQFIEPEIRRIYEYNMIYGEDNDCKVNCKVKANGFTSFQNKEIRGMRMKEALALFVSNEFLLPEIKIRPHLDVIYESMDEDPEKFLMSEEEKAEEAQNRANMEAEAQQKAIQAEAAAKEIETEGKIKEKMVDHAGNMDEKELEHKHRLIENKQKHEFQLVEDDQEDLHDMEKKEFESRVDRIYNTPKPREVNQNVYK
jgi:hypothetical protein